MCDKRTLNRDKINKTRRRQRQIVKAMARDIDMQVMSDETSTNVSEDELHEPRECTDHSGTSAEEHPEQSIIVGQEEPNSPDDMTDEQEDENSIRESLTEEEYEEIRSHTSESTDEEEERNIYQELREWAIESNIPQKNLDKLLDILRKRLLPELPKSAKTFLKTNSCTYDIRETESGQFVYFGLESGLRACIIAARHPENQIFLQVNVDGMSVFKSSSKQFWPILCKVHCPQMDVYTPFIVGCYCGDSKPHDLADYFHEFIYEINLLQRDGIILHAKRFKVYLKCFICDSPARALLKNVKGHGGFSACERCTVVGERVRKGKGFCTIYPDVDKQPRTNESFRNFDDPNHHNGVSPLLDILPPIDMIKLFLLDKLHLFDGGAMKKLIEYWHSGDLRVRLGRRSKLELNRRIASIKCQIPLEFQRKPRSTIYVAKWKCTEFRLFLLYIGPIILKNILQEHLYKHFLLLHVAARILCSDGIALIYNQHTKIYLEKFFLALKRLYGAHSQSLNNHNLIHVADDVKNMNCSLNCISAYPFESLLNKIKKSVRSAHLPLSQVSRRLHEAQLIKMKKAVIPNQIEIIKTQIIEAGIEQVIRVKYKSYILTDKAPDNVVFLQDESIIQIERMTILSKNPDMVRIVGKEFKKKKPLYTYPSNSKHVRMWELHLRPSLTTRSCRIDFINTKMMKLSLSLCPDGVKKTYALSLLHA